MTHCDSSIDLSNVTLAMLAGGIGRRMGMPKALLRIGGRPILAWLLDRLSWPGPTMLVSSPVVLEPPGRELFNQHVVDPVIGQGPLRGVMTALEHMTTPTAVVVTVDMPNIDQDKAAWLATALAQRTSSIGVMCRVRRGDEEWIEPFPSAFRAVALSEIATRAEQGRLSVQDLCGDAAFSTLPPPVEWPADAWINLNNPSEFAAFELAELKRARRT